MTDDRQILDPDVRSTRGREDRRGVPRGFEQVARIDRPAVALFGSARVDEGHPAYEAARAVGRKFARSTAGRWSPAAAAGVMEGANRGAREGGGLSVGFNIELPHEQASNPYLDISHTFDHFYARKVCFVKPVGGVRDLPRRLRHARRALRGADADPDRQVPHFPVVLFDSDYWAGMLDWIRDELLADGMISPADLELLHVTDDPDDAALVGVRCSAQYDQAHEADARSSSG